MKTAVLPRLNRLLRSRAARHPGLSALTVVLCLGVTGCVRQRNPVPADLVGTAKVPGFENVRTWGGSPSPAFQADMIESVHQDRLAAARTGGNEARAKSALALSGGGSDGAFGAGLLCGWTDAGTRPSFKMVTGISTGALIAPFAFLGSEHDDTLRKLYTQVSAKNIYRRRWLLRILGGADSLASSAPLKRLIAGVADEDFLDAVARAHLAGRRLYIGTTDLDAGRLVVWNMGAIASSNHPRALGLFQDILLASASIPVAFPPVYITVEAGEERYEEMHVDGGTVTQVFFRARFLDFVAGRKALGDVRRPKGDVYIIRNGKLTSEYTAVKAKVLAIASQAILRVVTAQGLGDLYRIHAIAQREGIGFNLASIPADFERQSDEAFDTGEMNRLFDLGYAMARNGYPWAAAAPWLEGDDRTPEADTVPARTTSETR